MVMSERLAKAVIGLAASEALNQLLEGMVVGNLIQKRYDCNEVMNSGDHKIEATFNIPDITKVLAVPQLMLLYMEPSITALVEKMETDILESTSRFDRVVASNSLCDSLDDIRKSLESANCFVIAHHEDYQELRRSPNFSEFRNSVEAGLPAPYISQPIGRYDNGVWIVRSQHVPKVGEVRLNCALDRKSLSLRTFREPYVELPNVLATEANADNFNITVKSTYQPNTLAQQYTIIISYGLSVKEAEGIQINTFRRK